MNNVTDFLHFLDRPPREYTPIPFWFLNDDLDHAEIRRQLKDFCDHGVYGVVLHPRMGLSERIGYLSPLFFDYIRTAVTEAKRLGMKIVLYDEGMYPSGAAGGQIVAARPDLGSRGIALTDQPQADDTLICRTEKGCLVERFSNGTIRGVHFGEDDGEPNAPRSADILNPEAVRLFIELTHEAYWRELHEEFGKTIVAMFTDEPTILGRNAGPLMPWSKGFADLFRQSGGHLEGLTGLFTGEENPDTALYRRLILQRESEVYYAPLSRWCEEHGIALTGHPHQSDDIEVERFFHIPGQDLVFRMVSPERGGTEGMDSVMGKCSADMARLMGRERNDNECFGACNRDWNPWYFTGGDMKWIIDWLAVRGVNLFIPHAFYYSLQGARSGERPPDVGPGSIWWPYYRQWADYMARLSWLMTNADLKADIAVPVQNRDLHAEDVAPLFKSQKGFHYLPESFWKECREEDGALICRGLRYRAVLGPSNLFPTVPHTIENIPPDCACVPPQPDLRAARLSLNGRKLWLLVNEGETKIRTTLTLPASTGIAQYDPWIAKAQQIDSQTTADGAKIALRLPRRGSMLLFEVSQAEWEALPAEIPAVPLSGKIFRLEADEPERHRKIYSAEIAPCSQDVMLSLDAEEMAELYVNGRFHAAAFWQPQEIRIPADVLKNGAKLRLIVTGSMANVYGTRPVWYGLRDIGKN